MTCSTAAAEFVYDLRTHFQAIDHRVWQACRASIRQIDCVCGDDGFPFRAKLRGNGRKRLVLPSTTQSRYQSRRNAGIFSLLAYVVQFHLIQSKTRARLT